MESECIHIWQQLNNVIFDHSLIVTEINFTNTLLYIYIAVEIVNNIKQFKLLTFAVSKLQKRRKSE